MDTNISVREANGHRAVITLPESFAKEKYKRALLYKLLAQRKELLPLGA